MRYSIIRSLIITSILTSLLVLGYYLLWLKPRFELPNALSTAQQIVAGSRVSLLQNRLALVELTRLDSVSADFNEERIQLLTEIQNSNEQGLQALDEIPDLPIITGAATHAVRFINTELGSAWSDLVNQHRSLLQEQQSLITSLISLESTVANIFQYSPQSDLAELDITADRDIIAARTRAAHDGLEAISQNLTNPPLQWPDTSALQTDITNTQAALTKLIEHLETESLQALEARDAVLHQFVKLKRTTLATFQSPMRSTASISLLTRHTNLIYQYDFWLQQIGVQLAQTSP